MKQVHPLPTPAAWRLIRSLHPLEVHNGRPCWRHWYAGLLIDFDPSPF